MIGIVWCPNCVLAYYEMQCTQGMQYFPSECSIKKYGDGKFRIMDTDVSVDLCVCVCVLHVCVCVCVCVCACECVNNFVVYHRQNLVL